MKKLILCLCLALFLSSCQASSEKSAKTPMELHFMLPSEPEFLDPSLASETYASQILLHLYEPLVKLSENGTIIPAAAESWTVNDDFTEITFTLRKNAKWSNGEPVTAEDFKMGLLRSITPSENNANGGVLAPYLKNGSRYFAQEVEKEEVGIFAKDEHTLILSLTSPTPFILEVLSYSGFVPVYKDFHNTMEKDWAKDPNQVVSNGPFKMSSYETQHSVVLEKNPYYWEASAIQLDTIEFLFRGQGEDIMTMYIDGELDGLYEITASELRLIPNSEPDTHSTILSSTAYLSMNHQSEIFSHLSMRKALSLAVDRDAFVKDALLGAGIATSYFVPFHYRIGENLYREFTQLTTPVDLDRAKTALSSAISSGEYDGRNISFYYMENGPDVNTTEYIAKQLEKDLNLTFDMHKVPWATLYNVAINGDYDLMMIGWSADYPHPMTFLGTFGENGIISQITHWKDPAYDDGILEFFQKDSPEEQLNSLRQLEDMILDDYHIIPLYYRTGISILNGKVVNWYRNTSAMFDFTRASIQE